MEITLKLPDSNLSKEDYQLLLAIKLFEEGYYSLAKAAEIAGYSEKSFSEILLNKGISPITYDNLDIQAELDNA